ncbi:MAG: HD domain-containing protein [bacterium]|jgi:HD-GYP domain-containing protein (c-di-GMP phosphodiesterase class II)
MTPNATRTEDSKLLIGKDQTREYQLANELIGRFYVLLRNTRTHDRNNRAVVANAQTALAKINGLLDISGRASFDIVGDSLFLNGIRLRPNFSNFQAFKSVVNQAKQHLIRSFCFDDSIDEDDLVAFASILATVDPDEDDPYAEIVERMEAEGIAGIEIGHVEERAPSTLTRRGKAPDPVHEVVNAFASALYFVGRSIDEGISDAGVTPRKMKRVVQLVVDNVLANEEDILGITSLKGHTGYTHQHSLNVCIYSVMLAHRLGLPKNFLREIGVAALFHDNGKVDVPAEVLDKNRALTREELEAKQDHTSGGVRALSHFKEADRTVVRAMLVAYLHHLNVDGSGYPPTRRKIKPDMVSRIVRIADIYDVLTSPRSPDLRPFTGEEALTAILSNAGARLDATLARAFAHVMDRP